MAVAQLKWQERSAAASVRRNGFVPWRGQRQLPREGTEHQQALQSAGSALSSAFEPCHRGTLGETVVNICCNAGSEGSGSAARASAGIKIHSALGGPG